MTWITLALALLLGSIPFSWLLVWLLKGVDLRTVGSGNPGATNAMRVIGKKWGGFAMALDVAKGAAACALIPALNSAQELSWLPSACGCMAIVGNVFTPFLRFKGGKAVAVAGGVFLALAPVGTALVAAILFLLLYATGKMSIASLTAATLLPIVLTIETALHIGDDPNLWVTGLVWLAALTVIARHKENIHRLLRGEESQIIEKPNGKSQAS